MHFSTTKRSLGLAAAAALTAAALASCGSSSNGATSPAAAGNSSAPAGGDNAALTQAKAAIAKLEQPVTKWPGIVPVKNPATVAGKHIMIVPLAAQVPILNGMAEGARAALEHLGATVTICDGQASPTTVGSCLNQAQSQKYYAVITNFVTFPMDANGFTSLANSGTKILIAGDSQVPGTSYPANVKFYDSAGSLKAVAEDEAKAAIARQGTNANVIWLAQTDSANTVNTGDEGEAAFKQLCPSCGFERINYATQDLDKLPSRISSALVSHPKTNEIVLSVDSIAPQVMQGVQSASFTGKVKLIGNGSDLDGLQRVKSGQETDDFGASALYDGYALAGGLIQELSGDPVTPAVNATRDLTSDNVGTLNLSADQYNTANWFGNDSFVNDFYQAWGAK